MSTLKLSTIQADTFKSKDNSREFYKCYAWVNFNGTGTLAIRGSGNVSSITDNGAGTYTINFINALPDRNYSICGTAWSPTVTASLVGIDATPTNSSMRITTTNVAATATVDQTEINISVFR